MAKLPPEVVRHDFFNLVVVGIIISLTFAHMITSDMLVFWCLWWFCEVYFAVDCIWVAVQPSCVKAPIEIIIHHIFTALYITVTWVQPSFSKLMCYNLLVEINTFFLILKRHIKSPILKFGFYLTWVTMRLIAYPLMAMYYIWMYYEFGKQIGTYVSVVILAPIIHTGLSCLNYYWTFTMLKQMKDKRKKDSMEKKSD